MRRPWTGSKLIAEASLIFFKLTKIFGSNKSLFDDRQQRRATGNDFGIFVVAQDRASLRQRSRFDQLKAYASKAILSPRFFILILTSLPAADKS